MNKSWLILRHEVTSLLRRFSFWFSVLGIPLIGLLIVGGVSLINRSQDLSGPGAGALEDVQRLLNPPRSPLPQGFVDSAHLIQQYPTGYNPTKLIRYTDPAAARRDLDAGKISAYYVIPPDYLTSGSLLAFTPQYDLVSSQQQSQDLRALIDFNLLKGDARLANAVDHPLANLRMVNLSPESTEPRDSDSLLTFFLPYGIMMLYFIAIMGSSSLMLNSISKEKENRVMEVLMVSVTPHQLLLGKIGGLGLVGLLQVAIWGGSSLALMRLSGQAFNLPDSFRLNPVILAWGLVFFMLGFLVYASLMAGVGALVPNLREASQATFIIMLPLTFPLFIISALINLPNGAAAVILSLFPLTSPTVMMLRLTATQVPTWQILLAVLLLALTALVVVRIVAGMFRAQTLLSGQPFQLRRLFLALVGRV